MSETGTSGVYQFQVRDYSTHLVTSTTPSSCVTGKARVIAASRHAAPCRAVPLMQIMVHSHWYCVRRRYQEDIRALCQTDVLLRLHYTLLYSTSGVGWHNHMREARQVSRQAKRVMVWSDSQQKDIADLNYLWYDTLPKAIADLN